MSWCWGLGEARWLVDMNLSDSDVQAQVRLPSPELASGSSRPDDALAETPFARAGGAILDLRLQVALPPWGCRLLRLQAR